MARAPSRAQSTFDVLVIGSHPACHLAAVLLKQSGLSVMLLKPPEPSADRLVQINPAFFDLHPLIGAMKKQIAPTAFHGVQFLGDQPGARGVFEQRGIAGYVADSVQVQKTFERLSQKQKVEIKPIQAFDVQSISEQGVTILTGGKSMDAKMLMIGATPGQAVLKAMGLSGESEPRTPWRYCYVRTSRWQIKSESAHLLMSLSLDLHGRQCWGWALSHDKTLQLAVAQPLAGKTSDSSSLLSHWAQVLHRHGLLPEDAVDLSEVCTLDLPLAGALNQECVGNRTLLIGPAGGFYSACAEDIYPNCWSALFAVETAVKALQEKHLQDALQSYRRQWGSTLGDYLRGPQQNLRFLLPLVYRNPVMCARLAEAVLTGASVMR